MYRLWLLLLLVLSCGGTEPLLHHYRSAQRGCAARAVVSSEAKPPDLVLGAVQHACISYAYTMEGEVGENLDVLEDEIGGSSIYIVLHDNTGVCARSRTNTDTCMMRDALGFTLWINVATDQGPTDYYDKVYHETMHVILYEHEGKLGSGHHRRLADLDLCRAPTHPNVTSCGDVQ